MMKSGILAALLSVSVLALAPLAAPTAALAAEPAPVGKSLIEIYRIAPGKHKEFLEFIRKCDEVNLKAGLPARQLYVHSDGADWDFILIQPASTPPEKAEALDRAWDESGLPSGSNFFFEIRKFIAEHSDTFAKGPTTAADYLATSK